MFYRSKVIRVYLFGVKFAWHPGSEIWGFLGILTPKCNFLSTRPPKDASSQQTASFEPSCVQIGLTVLAVDDYKKKGKVGKVR
jgi:hypothetical protein